MCSHTAGVRSPFLDPVPMPFPPIVMWKIWVRPLLIELALNSKETLHSFFRTGRVVRRLLFVISVSYTREKIVLHVPAKDDQESCLTFITYVGCPYSLKSLLEFHLNVRICWGYKIRLIMALLPHIPEYLRIRLLGWQKAKSAPATSWLVKKERLPFT